MAFITETGEGLANATSYVSVDEADDYFDTYGDKGDWPSDDDSDDAVAKKEAALSRATRAVDLLYGQRFQSYPSFPQRQSLQFPRATFYINTWQFISSTSIPRLLKEAVMEIASLDLAGEEIYPNTTESSAVESERMKLGDLELDLKYGSSTTAERLQGFYKIELILNPLLKNGGADGVYTSYMSL